MMALVECPVERKVKRGKLLTSLVHYGDRYHVKFDMWIEEKISQVGSVIHIGNTDESRMPAVYLHPNNQLQINVKKDNNILYNVQAGRWYNIDISKRAFADSVSSSSWNFLFKTKCRGVFTTRSRWTGCW